MKMVKCFKGHIYDADKFSSCPQCAALDAGEPMPVDDDQDDIDTEDPVTVKQRAYEIVGRRKVAGCLICTEGVMRGEGFLLVEGDNDIGRAPNLEVVLSKETTVSRAANACITYDGNNNEYILSAARDKAKVICNGNPVSESVRIENGAIIAIGQCVLRFVPFCDDNFSWEM